jgi:hypothetical protein
MLKIQKNVNKKSDWLLVNCDFRSLQMLLAFSDCGINKDGISQIAYDIYGEKGCNDAHSVTALNTFCSPVHLQVIEIEDEKGNKHVFGEEQKIKIRRKGLLDEPEEIEIFGKKFEPDDEFIDYV